MKQLGLSENSLQRLIENGITVGLISEEFYCVKQEDNNPSLYEKLQSLGFDRCGINNGDCLIGYVEPNSKSTSVEELKPFQIEQIVAETNPLWSVLPRLTESKWLLVLTSSGPPGIATVADLTKQPARLLMFGLISSLEMTLLELIRCEHPDEKWSELLSSGRLDKANELLNLRKENNQEIDLTDCLQLSDKKTICANTERFLEEWGLTKTNFEKRFRKIEKLRDRLAHAQYLAPDGNWSGVVQSLKEADKLIRKSMEFLQNQG